MTDSRVLENSRLRTAAAAFAAIRPRARWYAVVSRTGNTLRHVRRAVSQIRNTRHRSIIIITILRYDVIYLLLLFFAVILWVRCHGDYYRYAVRDAEAEWNATTTSEKEFQTADELIPYGPSVRRVCSTHDGGRRFERGGRWRRAVTLSRDGHV